MRTAILGVLDEQPRNGYQVIQRIAERTDGAWRPSPGSVCPTLQQLEDEDLVAAWAAFEPSAEEAALTILAETRRRLHGLLAEGDAP